MDASRTSSAAQTTQVESAILNIWRAILDLDEVALDDDFFELGGDSLAVVRMLAALEDELMVPVSFTEFLDAPTIGGLAGRVGAPVPADTEGAPAPAAQGGTAVVSYAQERLWFLEQLGGATSAYNMPMGARIMGPISVPVLQGSLTELVARHAALRTGFVTREGRAVQEVLAEATVELERADVSEHADAEGEAHRVADRFVSQALALEHPPLMRALLIALGEADHALLLVFNHIVCDGWSQVVAMRELGVLYQARAAGVEPDLPPPRIQYPEYAAAQRRDLSGAALDEVVEPWVARLRGAPAGLDLPTDHPRPRVPTYAGATHRHRLPAQAAERVRAFARSQRATPFATLLAVYTVLLSRHSGQDDIVVGATTAGRDRPELSDGIGLFASTVALRCDLAGEPTFSELVARVRDTVLWAVAHESAPFEQIVARLGMERDLSRHPVFQVFCAHVPEIPPMLDGAAAFDVLPTASRFDLTLFVEEERGEQFDLAWEYSTDLFDPATIERFADHYLGLLDAALSDPDTAIGVLPMGGPASAATAEVQTDGLTEYPVGCLHELFEARVADAPDEVAVAFGDQSLTYAELNRDANRLARHLRSLGAGPETLVALYVEPSLETVITVLGVLKAGSAYVPLDPEYPADRIAFILEDTGAPLLVCGSGLGDRLPASGARVIHLDETAALLAGYEAENPEPLARPENLAYVIYTSGSTGQPKGVQVEHRQVARLLSATDDWYGFGPSDTWLLLHSYAFDFSVWELWGALAYGGRLVISPLWTTRSPQALAELMSTEGVTVMNATPSLFVVLQDELLRAAGKLALRYVVFGGEALAPAALLPWFEHYGDGGPTLVNMYGITETTVHVTYRPISPSDCESEVSPLGVPIPDLTLHLLDPHGAPVDIGVPGELFVGGAGVARGYLNRPELTAERFIENPFGPGRLYRTGDVARRLASGELDFRGRIDDQVKVRGFRIELGEVAAAIREVQGVTDCAVIAVDAAPGDTRLAAYVVADGDREESRQQVLEHLSRRLPAYMVPASVLTLDELPLTRNGKTDRKALPPPAWETPAKSGAVPPQTATERLVAEVWSSVLGIEQLGREDNFFNLGGHSLLVARVATEIRKRRQVRLSVRALFEQPTLSGFAAHLDSLGGAEPEAEPAVSSPTSEPDLSAAAVAGAVDASSGPLSFQQQQLLFFDALERGNVTYNAALAIRVEGELDQDALREALEALFQRHEALRTVFEWDGDSGRQRVLESWDTEVPVVDLSGLDPDARAAELERLLPETARRPFDLAHDLMLRTTLFRLSPTQHVILFAPHHIAFDAWAVEVFYRDLSELYRAAQLDQGAELPELSHQYLDFARSQREQLAGGRLAGELDFWRAHLAGAPTVLDLETDRPRPPVQTYAGERLELELEAELAEAVRAACRTYQVTPYMLFLATFAALLYRRTGQDDILFGGPMANRGEGELANLIGFFANTIVVRAKARGNPTFADFLAEIRESVLLSIEHQEIPLELVVDAVRPQRYPGVNPLFQVNFRVRVGAAPELALAGAQTSPVPVNLGLARFDLALEVHLLDDRIEVEWGWNTALFEPETVLALAADLELLLRQALADPGARLLAFQISDGTSAARPGETNGAAGGIRGFRGSARREAGVDRDRGAGQTRGGI